MRGRPRKALGDAVIVRSTTRVRSGLIRQDALVASLVALVRRSGGETTPEHMSEVLRLAAAAADPSGARDLTPHEVLRIRLSKAVARALPPEIYRDRPTRARLRAEVSDLIEAHGVPRGTPRLPPVA